MCVSKVIPAALKRFLYLPLYTQTFEGHKFHEFHRRQHFCEIFVLDIRILALRLGSSIRENKIVEVKNLDFVKFTSLENIYMYTVYASSGKNVPLPISSGIYKQLDS